MFTHLCRSIFFLLFSLRAVAATAADVAIVPLPQPDADGTSNTMAVSECMIDDPRVHYYRGAAPFPLYIRGGRRSSAGPFSPQLSAGLSPKRSNTFPKSTIGKRS